MLISASFYSQTASAIFKSENNEAFQITINNIKQQNSYSNSSIVYYLPGDRAYNLKIEFKDDSTFIQKNIYLIDDGLAHLYTVTKEDIQLKKVIPVASYTEDGNELAIIYQENAISPIDVIIKDSIETKDTTYVIPFASYYKLDDYDGKIGCPFPIKDIEQAKLRGIMLAESLEESKLEKVKIAIQDMDSACVLIDQVKELVLLLEYEETRLDLSKFMVRYIFDIDNYEKLYPAFNFENSKEELKKSIKKVN